MEQPMSIGEVATSAGLRPSAIRFYESAGLLDPPARSGGKRRYEAHVLQRLAVIQLAQRAGFTVGEIGQLLGGASDLSRSTPWQEVASRKLVDIRALIKRSREMERWLEDALRCDCLKLEDCQLVMECAQTAEPTTRSVVDFGASSTWTRWTR